MRKPKLIISRCLNSEKCRYDGNGFDDKIISLIRDYVDIETVCPESDIGLPMPRDPIRIEKDEDSYRLIQTKTNRDYSDMMTEFAEEFVSGIDDIDGFILKSRSPTCGIKDVKIYPKGKKCSIKNNGTGFFSAKVINKYTDIPIENEGRLKNYEIRDEFLTKIFTINDLKSEKSIKDFHKKNCLLLKSYDYKKAEQLDSIAGKDVLNDEDIDLYNKKVYEILEKKRSRRSSIKAAQSAFVVYKNKLTEKEVTYFERLLDLYSEKKIPFSSVKTALEIYGLRFDDNDLLNQTFFNPYPEDLMSMSDSGKGRSL
ncbi:DUF523 and DUF1722 domain-containing protein [uncultured Clostridium sp.]|uniref:YbgA family protein n=1 Tax=uncultured Clostridium sp. TaxID=59620 RepID=UPI0025EE22DF|nr:DUF523 and DUF1722 domain-containing protein [uncultured Clostridium sp.]